MAIVKTAISIDENIFQQAEEVACLLKVSRSRAFAMAMEEFAKRKKSERITQQINESYSDAAENEDRAIVRQMRSSYHPHAEMEW